MSNCDHILPIESSRRWRRPLQSTYLGLLFILCSCSESESVRTHNYQGSSQNPHLSTSGLDINFGLLKSSGISSEEGEDSGLESNIGTNTITTSSRSILVLAENRTNRPDILSGFRRYKGGWNITDKHYWASVGYTGSGSIILGILWFFLFGAALLFYLCCCKARRKYVHNKSADSESGSKRSIQLLAVVVFTCVSASGCIVLSVGQGSFHGEVMSTTRYVVNQSDYTVETLKNVADILSLANSINVSEIILSADIRDDINDLSMDLSDAADTLSTKTHQNATKVKRLFGSVKSAMIVAASIMLLLATFGLVLSLWKHQGAVHIFLVSGWLLVTFTFLLSGVFVIFNSAIEDSCLAMRQWADNPEAQTALSDMLPCVDEKTTNQTLAESDKVVAGIVNMVNQFIYTFADTERPQGDYFYYNQSGPLLPTLCYPPFFDINDQHDDDYDHDHYYYYYYCGQQHQQVPLMNASLVWEKYVCHEVQDGICTTTGRLTPAMYSQLVAAVNVSYGIKHYTPPILSLKNCNFVRETFAEVTSTYCPPLEHYLRVVNAGLGLIAVGVMLTLITWIFFMQTAPRS